jgi:crossover junction endodeoxyribonuclease RusA
MILNLPFPPSVNNLFINVKRGRVRSPDYRAWAELAGMRLNQQHPMKITGPVSLIYEFQEGQDKRRRDIANLEKATTDLLVEHQVIEADDNRIVREIVMRWSRDVIGAQITITKVSTT